MPWNWSSLRDYRISHGLTVGEMAKRLGCDMVRVTRIERGLEDMTEEDYSCLQVHDFRISDRTKEKT